MAVSNTEHDQQTPALPPRAVLSRPVELLLEEQAREPGVIDVIIVGSGYGGAVAAARLAGAKTRNGKTLNVVVLERGREYLPGDFPNRAALLPGHTRLSREGATQAAGVREGLFDLRLGRRVSALVANGLGGGSLINAGLMARPDPLVRDQLLGWRPVDGRPARDRLALELEESFLRAERMLGAEVAPEKSHKGVPLIKRERLADLGRSTGRPLEPAAVTIAFKPREAASEANEFTQKLDACVHCGDCFSGCNIGAKKSLDTNYLALARARGAQLFSGATVTHLQPLADSSGQDACWAVHLELTDEKLARSDRQPPPLRARWVILAAGTFGTFEILRRSEQVGWPLASSALGQRFSGNGDSICAVHDPDHDANSVANESIGPGERNVGPTISGLVRAKARDETSFVIEDLASPAPLQRLFEEVVTTQRMVTQIGQFDWSTHRAATGGQDSLAIDPGVIRRTAVYAAMGDDGAAGQLTRSPQWQGDGGAFADWPKDHAPSRHLYDAQIAWFRSALRGRRATLVPNPLWQPLPEALAEFFGDVGRSLLTVHPLGGCRMSDGPAEGVVDFSGRVFKRDTPPLNSDDPLFHEGLLVVDGSVLPGAIGINPALTIAALAERSIARLMTEQQWNESTGAEQLEVVRLQPPTAIPRGSTGFDLKERMVGPIRPLKASGELDAMVTLAAEPIDDLMAFLLQGDRTVKFREASLRLRDGKNVRDVALASAQLQLLVRGRSSAFGRLVSALKALWINRRHDLSRRPWYVLLLGLLLELLRHPQASLRKLCFLLAFATHFGERRNLIYRFELDDGVKFGEVEAFKRGTLLVGVKTIEYAVDANPWEQLMQLSLHEGGEQGPVIGTLKVDLGYFAEVQQPLLSLTAQRDQPSALMDLLSFGLFVGRMLAKIHFWSFRLPDDYPIPVADDDDLRRRRLPQAGLGEARFDQQTCRFDDGTPRLTLSHYVPKNPAEKTPPIVLIHGFSASGSTFAHPAIPGNMVQSLMDEGREVWVADLRTSIGHRGAARAAAAFDEVAREDVTDAIRAVFATNNNQPVDVFAHCVGAAMFCQAVMLGLLRHENASMVRSAVLSQTAPFIRMKPQNQLRAFLALYLRHFLGTETLDPLSVDFAGLHGNFIDRLLATFPYPRGERAQMSGRRGHAPYAKYRVRTDAVFGQLFNLKNLHESTLAALPDLLGEINLDSYAQTIHWVRRGILTDILGRDAITRASALREHFDFPVQFLHGEDNEVFAVTGAQIAADLLPTGQTKILLIEGYGHQDVVLSRPKPDPGAKEAPNVITGHRAIELAHPALAASTGTPTTYSRKPAIGPVLGWLRINLQGNFDLRVLVGEKLYAPTRRFDFTSPAAEVLQPDEREVSRSGVAVYDLPLSATENSAEVRAGNLVQLPDGDVPLTGPLTIQWMKGKGATFTRPGLVLAQLSPGQDRRVPASQIINPDGTSPLRNLSPSTLHASSGGGSSSVVAPKESTASSPVAEAGPGQHDSQPALISLSEHIRAAADLGRPSAFNELARLTFVVGSCSYPPQIFDRGLAQRSMKHLLERLKQKPKPQFLVLLGDQIYADATANVADPRSPWVRYEEATERWMELPGVRDVLAQVPVYMMLDDHEIDDQYEPNMWPPGSPRARLLPQALETFHRWQGSLAPNSEHPLRRTPDEYNPYFDFFPGGYPFFVLNTRTRRDPRSYRAQGRVKVSEQAAIIDAEQMAALKRFLSAAQKVAPLSPKFIASPSVVFPEVGMRSQRSLLRCDGWSGFGRSTSDLISFIEEQGIENVVFLCGDYHASAAASATTKSKGCRLLSIVSSGLYAPYPFANAQIRDFVSGARPIDSDLPLAEVKVRYCTNRNGFAVVDVKPRSIAAKGPRLTVTFHYSDGSASKRICLS